MFVCGDVAKRFSPSHVLQIDNDMVFEATAHRRSSWLNPANSRWWLNGSALKTESTTAGGKRQRTRSGQNVVVSIPRRLGCIPTVDCICMALKRLLACSSASFIFDRHFWANDQATDESLIINQLWNDHADLITFLPPDFNVSMLQTPEWATNPVMQSFVYHFIGPSKPHLDRCRWQRSNPPELPFPDNRQSIELINDWKEDPPATYDIGSIFRPDLAANLLAVYPKLLVSGTWSDELTVYDERLTSLDENVFIPLCANSVSHPSGVNARRFKTSDQGGRRCNASACPS